MTIRWKSKILLLKLEATYGVDAAPTGADNAILATNVTFSPMEGQDISRDLELPWLAAQASLAAGLHSRMTFRIELVGSGTEGVAPAWGPVMRVLGCAQSIVTDTSVSYNPVTDGHESGTVHFWVGGTRYVVRGTRGTGIVRCDAQGIPYLEVTLQGLFSLPSEQTRANPTLTGFKAPEIVTNASATFGIDDVPLVMRSFSLNLGNDVQNRFLVGFEGVVIPDRAETIQTQVEAVPLTTFDPYAMALPDPVTREVEPVPVDLVHGTTAGFITTLTVPGAQMMRPAGLANQQGITEWPLTLTPLPVSGNDQWVLTLT